MRLRLLLVDEVRKKLCAKLRERGALIRFAFAHPRIDLP
jgi:hypothetical protein